MTFIIRAIKTLLEMEKKQATSIMTRSVTVFSITFTYFMIGLLSGGTFSKHKAQINGFKLHMLIDHVYGKCKV